MPFPLLAAAIGPAIAAAGSIGSNLIQANAAGKQGDAAMRASGIGAQAAGEASRAGIQGLKKARKAGMGQLRKGIGVLEPFAQAGEGANDLLSNLLGVNGPEAQEAAYEVYQQSPGLQDLINKAMADIDQSAAHGGNLRSGNTMSELLLRGGRLRLEDFRDWQDRLTGMSAQGLGAATNQANIRTQMAQLSANTLAGQGRFKAGGILGAAGSQMGGVLGQSTADTAQAGAYGNMFETGAGLAGSLVGPLSTSIGNLAGRFTPILGGSDQTGIGQAGIFGAVS